MSYVATMDEFWIDNTTRLPISLEQRDGLWKFRVSTEHRSGSNGMRPGACIVFALEHLRRFSDSTAKSLRGAPARDIMPVPSS
jgi:hypothetical protein